MVQIKVNVGGGGGGATHIATKPGLLSELENYKTSEIIIAAGGGGGANVDGTNCHGGYGGGTCGTQTSGYAFGLGGSVNTSSGGQGGGG